MDRLRCVVERITYQNEKNGYSVLKCRVKGYNDLVPVVGAMPETHVGSVLTLTGEWKMDAKYGRQFSIFSYEETLPATVYGIEKYLGSGLVKGIGPKFAGRIVRQFGADTLNVIEAEPDRLLEVPGIGSVRVERIKKSWFEQKEIKNIMFGLMRMETVILSVTQKDVPLLNIDWVKVPGKQTLIGELYNTQLEPWPNESQAAFLQISERDYDLPDYESGSEHWYDSLLYPCSYHKAGRGIASRLERSSYDFIRLFVSQLEKASTCDYEAKKAKIEAFAQNLSANGGSAVKLFKKLFGEETAKRVVIHHMYGV